MTTDMDKYLVITDQTKRAKIVKRRIPEQTGYRLVLTVEPGVNAHTICDALNMYGSDA